MRSAFEEITVDCYDDYEVLSAFKVYLTDALRMPFAASWSEPSTRCRREIGRAAAFPSVKRFQGYGPIRRTDNWPITCA
ncbi:MAG: calcium-binding protein [Chloroflexota bacterium]|nr:calcium-binding protein [Chloroflexota bacterium]